MSADDIKNTETVFQTPNPTQLKAEAKEDPIQEREGAQEVDVADIHLGKEDPNVEDEEMGREASAEMSHSPITTTNLSGH